MADTSGADDRAGLQACADQQDALAKARNPERTEAERLRAYMEVTHALADRVDQNQRLIDRSPEVAFAGGNEAEAATETRQAVALCRDLLADSRREFEEFVRELFSPLLVMDVQAGHHGRSARVSLALLRSALEELKPPDFDALNDKINEADKVLQASHKGG